MMTSSFLTDVQQFYSLLAALKSLKNTIDMVDNEQAALATFKISGGKRKGLSQLLATHPDLDERIERLERA